MLKVEIWKKGGKFRLTHTCILYSKRSIPKPVFQNSAVVPLLQSAPPKIPVDAVAAVPPALPKIPVEAVDAVPPAPPNIPVEAVAAEPPAPPKIPVEAVDAVPPSPPKIPVEAVDAVPPAPPKIPVEAVEAVFPKLNISSVPSRVSTARNDQNNDIGSRWQ